MWKYRHLVEPLQNLKVRTRDLDIQIASILRFPWSRIVSSLVAVALFVVLLHITSPFLIILCLFGCAVSLLICVGPPLQWYVNYYIKNEGGHVSEGVEGKLEIFTKLTDNSKKAIKILAGELDSRFFNHEKVVKALYNAVERGVTVQIISGDLGESSEEDFRESLVNENPNLMKTLRKYLKSGDIEIFFGPRRDKHFYVFDDEGVIEEEPHNPYDLSSWYWRKYTSYIAPRDSAEFESAKKNMKQVHFQ